MPVGDDNRTPAEAFHPGEYLCEELETRKLSIVEFAKQIGRPIREIRTLIAEETRMTPDLADVIAVYFGQNRGTWMNLQATYDKAISEKRE